MQDLQGAKLTFETSALSGFTDGEKMCMYVFPHILNRLKLLDSQIFSHWAITNDEYIIDPVRDAALCGVVESLILTAGELKEAWEAIQTCYYGSKLCRTS